MKRILFRDGKMLGRWLIILGFVFFLINGKGQIIHKTQASTKMIQKEMAQEEIQLYKIQLGGKSYTMPIRLEELLADGWSFGRKVYVGDAKFGEVVSYEMGVEIQKNHMSAKITLLKDDPLPSDEVGSMLVIAVEASPEVLWLDDIDSRMPQVAEISPQMTQVDLIRRFSPDRLWDGYQEVRSKNAAGGNIYQYRYEGAAYNQRLNDIADSSLSFSFDVSGKLQRIKVVSVYLDMEAILDQYAVIPTGYQKVTYLGRTPQSFTFILDDKYYKLPVPVIQLLEDGWKIELGERENSLRESESSLVENVDSLRESESSLSEYEDSLRESESSLSEYEHDLSAREASQHEMVRTFVDAGEQIKVLLCKEDKCIEVFIRNTEVTPQRIQNCWIVGLSMNSSTTAQYILPKKIRLGMTKDQVLSKYKNQPYRLLQYDNSLMIEEIKEFKTDGENECESGCASICDDACEILGFYHSMRQNSNPIRSSNTIYYDGILAVKFRENRTDSILYLRTKGDAIGGFHIEGEEQKLEIHSNQELHDYFYYDRTGHWYGGYGSSIHFIERDYIIADSAGEEWFCGDHKQKCIMDVQNQRILMQTYETDAITVIPYEIISSERVVLTIDGEMIEFCTDYIEANTVEPIMEPEVLVCGETRRLGYTNLNDTVKFMKFTSSTDSVATVSEDGIVTARKPGETIIEGIIIRNGVRYHVSTVVVVER